MTGGRQTVVQRGEVQADRLHLSSRHREEVEALLREHLPGVEVWAYGNRVNAGSHEGSDLNLVLRSLTLEPLGEGYLELLEAIEKSDIPGPDSRLDKVV